MGLRYTDGENGDKAYLTGPWQVEFREDLLEHSCTELVINYTRGWQGADLNFLKTLQFIDSLVVIDRQLQDDSGVNALFRLRSLQLNTFCKNELNLSNFPSLRFLAMTSRTKADSFLECASIEFLRLHNWVGKDMSCFANLEALRSFTLSSRTIESLDGIEKLSRLTEFSIIEGRRLRNINAIACLNDLQVLEFYACRQIDLSALQSVTGLTKLSVDSCGNVASLTPIASNTSLEILSFEESTNIQDGALDFLLEFKRLRIVVFNNRRHYSLKRADLVAEIDRRNRCSSEKML